MTESAFPFPFTGISVNLVVYYWMLYLEYFHFMQSYKLEGIEALKKTDILSHFTVL